MELPVSERIERGYHKINGQTAVKHTTPFGVNVVVLRSRQVEPGVWAKVEDTVLYDEARTLAGAKRKASALAKECATVTGFSTKGRAVAVTVEAEGVEEVLYRVEVQR